MNLIQALRLPNSQAVMTNIARFHYQNIYTQLYTLMYQSKNELILYYQLQGNNKTDLSVN